MYKYFACTTLLFSTHLIAMESAMTPEAIQAEARSLLERCSYNIDHERDAKSWVLASASSPAVLKAAIDMSPADSEVFSSKFDLISAALALKSGRPDSPVCAAAGEAKGEPEGAAAPVPSWQRTDYRPCTDPVLSALRKIPYFVCRTNPHHLARAFTRFALERARSTIERDRESTTQFFTDRHVPGLLASYRPFREGPVFTGATPTARKFFTQVLEAKTLNPEHLCRQSELDKEPDFELA